MGRGRGESEVGDCQDRHRGERKAEARAKLEIARIAAAEASERTNIEAKVSSRERDNAAKRNIEEAGARIRAREEAKTAKRERTEAEARSREEAKIREKSKRAREDAEA